MWAWWWCKDHTWYEQKACLLSSRGGRRWWLVVHSTWGPPLTPPFHWCWAVGGSTHSTWQTCLQHLCVQPLCTWRPTIAVIRELSVIWGPRCGGWAENGEDVPQRSAAVCSLTGCVQAGGSSLWDEKEKMFLLHKTVLCVFWIVSLVKHFGCLSKMVWEEIVTFRTTKLLE